jgi:hypothetical protein
MTCAPTATRTRDLPLRRSSHVLEPTAASLVRAAFLVVWLPLDVYGLRPLRARGGHEPGQVSPTGAVVLGHSPYHVDSGSTLNCCDAGQDRCRCRPGAGQCLRFSPRSGTRLARGRTISLGTGLSAYPGHLTHGRKVSTAILPPEC